VIGHVEEANTEERGLKAKKVQNPLEGKGKGQSH
jgi:hypothetical protein